jgi:predicted transcriptional regulator
MPVFQLGALVDALVDLGYSCQVGDLSDIHPTRRPYFERWLSHRDGFVKVLSGNISYIGIEDVVRMGPFYNVYCIVENNSVYESDDNAHKLLDASPYYQLYNCKVTSMGWSGSIVADILAKDTELSREFANNIMKEEVKNITLKAANYACIIETRAWEPVGIASAFAIIDRIAYDVRQLIKSIHLGENFDK